MRILTSIVAGFLATALSGCATTASKPPDATPSAAAPAPAAKPPAPATQKPAPAAQKPTATTQKPATPPAAPAAPGAAPAAPPAAPKPLSATSGDGTRIAYEVAGSGPALLLVHGGGQTRRSWNQLGYVDRLSKQFTVITLDMRGTGDSGKPLTRDAYALDHLLADLLAVADAAKAPRFHVFAFGQGATVARYLVARSDRVISAALVGMTMGPVATGVFKDAITAMKAKWQPAIDAQAAGSLDAAKLSPGDRAAWEGGMATSVLALTAMLDYPALEPTAIKVPTLWAVGSDDSAAEQAKGYEGKLSASSVTLKIMPSLNYSDSFVKMDQILAEVEPFLTKAKPAAPPK